MSLKGLRAHSGEGKSRFLKQNKILPEASLVSTRQAFDVI